MTPSTCATVIVHDENGFHDTPTTQFQFSNSTISRKGNPSIASIESTESIEFSGAQPAPTAPTIPSDPQSPPSPSPPPTATLSPSPSATLSVLTRARLHATPSINQSGDHHHDSHSRDVSELQSPPPTQRTLSVPEDRNDGNNEMNGNNHTLSRSASMTSPPSSSSPSPPRTKSVLGLWMTAQREIKRGKQPQICADH